MDSYQKDYYAYESSKRTNSVSYMDVAKQRIEPVFPGLVFREAGGSVPFQASGTWLDIADFYFRFRSDVARLTIGRPGRYVPYSDFVVYKENVFNEQYAGSLNNAGFVSLFTELMHSILAETGLPR